MREEALHSGQPVSQCGIIFTSAFLPRTHTYSLVVHGSSKRSWHDVRPTVRAFDTADVRSKSHVRSEIRYAATGQDPTEQLSKSKEKFLATSEKPYFKALCRAPLKGGS